MDELAAIEQTLGPLCPSPADVRLLRDCLTERRYTAAVRLRDAATARDLPFATASIPWSPRGRIVLETAEPGRVRPAASPHYAAGEFYIQDAAAQLAVGLLRPLPGEQVCDLCAAPGGKSTQILEELGGDGWLLANEPVQSRLPVLEFNLARHGATRYLVSAFDPADMAEALGPRFDAVLVDAPCSGQSLVSRGKQSWQSFTPRTVAHAAARQARILKAAARLVRPGGRLVYSTCTFAYDENEARIADFLREFPAWRPLPTERLRDYAVPDFPGCYRLWPHRHHGAGAFAACLAQTGDGETRGECQPGDGGPVDREDGADRDSPADRLKHAGRGRTGRGAPKLERVANDRLPSDGWGDLSGVFYTSARQRMFAWPSAPPNWLAAVAVAGPEAAFIKGATWFPSYCLAMRRDGGWRPRQTVELNDAELASYLRGESLARSDTGWSVATWRRLRLGWVKGDGRRLRNHLPKSGWLQLRSSFVDPVG